MQSPIKITFAISLSVCALSTSAQAAEVWHTASIRSVYPQSDGSFVLTFETNAPACSNPNPYKYHHVTPTQNGMTEEGAKKVYAAALVAKAASLPVQINFDDSPTCATSIACGCSDRPESRCT